MAETITMIHLTEEDAVTLIKDLITLVMMEQVAVQIPPDIEAIKHNAYRLVADAVKDLDENVKDLDDLLLEAAVSNKLKEKIVERVMNNEVEL